MNKNKLIFAIIGGVILVLIALGALMLQSSTGNKKTTQDPASTGIFKIWIVGDSKKGFTTFLSAFKEANKGFSQLDFQVESFANFEEYSQSLMTAFIKGEAPDIFVLDNNEQSLFEDKVLAIGNDVVNITEFRENYNTLFAEDLIISSGGGDSGQEESEFLKSFPVGYETLGVLYDRGAGLKAPDFNSLSSINSAIDRIGNTKLTPISLGNGSTIVDSGDILAQFFLLNKVSSLSNAKEKDIKKSLGEYTKFGNVQYENGYNSLYDESKATGRNNIEFLLEGSVGSVITYPRSLKRLEGVSSLKNLLFAAPFPHSYSGDGKSLARYQGFAIHNETEQIDAAHAFIQYLNTDEGSLAYLNTYKYYLPARVNLEEDLRDRKISSYFSAIVLGNFYSIEPLSSFDKGNRVLYDRGVQEVLDDFSSYESSFSTFRNVTLCQSDKILNLGNLGRSCE